MENLSESPKTRVKKWPIVVTFIILFILGLFVWRIVHFMRLYQSGEIYEVDLSFVEQTSTTKALQDFIETEAVLADVATSDDPSLGNENAALTIVEFADFGCGYSRDSSFIVRSLMYEYGDRVRFIYRDFPLAEINADSQLAAEAGECAQDQGKFWEFHDKLYQNQSDLSKERMIEHAEFLGMDTTLFAACLNSRMHEDEVLDDFQAGLAAGVRGTPSFFFNGKFVPGAIPADILRQLIDGFLEEASN